MDRSNMYGQYVMVFVVNRFVFFFDVEFVEEVEGYYCVDIDYYIG